MTATHMLGTTYMQVNSCNWSQQNVHSAWIEPMLIRIIFSEQQKRGDVVTWKAN